MKIILASASPRRKELLKRIIPEFEIESSDFDEHSIHFDYHRLPYELSRLKAYHVFQKHPEDIVIASDTIVVYQGEIFEKPVDRDDARRIISRLSGSKHQVYTSYTIISKNFEISRTVETVVYFREIPPQEIEEYILTDTPYDKSGAYAIQNPDYVFVKKIEGEVENVVGFPIKEIRKDLINLKVIKE